METYSITLNNFEKVRGKEEAGGIEKQPGTLDDGESTKGGDTNGRKEDKRFECEDGAGVLH